MWIGFIEEKIYSPETSLALDFYFYLLMGMRASA